MLEALEQYWLDKDCYLVFFGDVGKSDFGFTVREAEYHADTDEVVVIDVFWDNDDDMTGASSIDPITLKYSEDIADDPHISREEYEWIVEYVRNAAKESVKKCRA